MSNKTEVRELTDRLAALADFMEPGDIQGGALLVRQAAAAIKLLRIDVVEATNRADRLGVRVKSFETKYGSKHDFDMEGQLSHDLAERHYETETGGI